MRIHLSRAPSRGAPGGRPPGSAADRGSITIFVVVFVMIALALASLLVDLGNAVNAQERAADVAEQAARAAADTIDMAALRNGNVAIDRAQGCINAKNLIQHYAQVSGVDATMTQPCTFQGQRRVTVFVSVTTTPLISTAFGSFTMKAHESACAEFGIDQGSGC